MVVAAVGVLLLVALSILCFAAYKIKARSFEVSTSVGRVASFSIKIVSADHEDGPGESRHVGAPVVVSRRPRRDTVKNVRVPRHMGRVGQARRRV
jgi:hypothetical protein